MADNDATITPRPQRNRKPNPPKDRNTEQPTTPGRSNTPRQATPSEKHATGYHSSSGRMQNKRNGNRQQQRPYDHLLTAIPNVDGASSPSKPIPINPKDENKNPLATPAKQAYAGPTFHASPAPSSLPMPRFFSKAQSLPANSALAPTEEALPHGASPTKNPPPSPSPVVAANATVPQAPIPREASPLDLLFNAHRAEKVRERSTGSGTSYGNANDSSISPYRHPVRPFPGSVAGQGYAAQGGNAGYSSDTSRDASFSNSQRPSNKEMFMMEVDAPEAQRSQQPSSPLSFEQRLRAVQAQASPTRASNVSAMDDDQRLAKSLALKQLLKGQAAEQLRLLPPNVPHAKGQPLQQGMPDIPGIAGTPPNIAMQTPPGDSSPDLRAMEANLRKLLKLGP